MAAKRFIADVMVGKLATYLRMAGFDVIYSNDADDASIVQTAEEEDRIVLTRDTMMLKRKKFTSGIIKSVFISSGKLNEQLLQVSSELGMKLESRLAICLVCNTPLEEADKEGLEGKVPPYVYRTQKNFMYCPKCGKYYWRGTHYSYMKKYFKSLNNSRI